MDFQYNEELSQLEDCPPEEYAQINKEAFRFTYAEIDNEDNFKPQIKKNPKRFITKNDKVKCCAFALSFFKCRDSALSFYNSLPIQTRALLGTHLAQGNLQQDDGVSGKVDNKGHFNFHVASGVELKNNFTVLAQIYSDE